MLRHSAPLDQKEITSLLLRANTKFGAFTRSIDKASPRYHASSLYNGKSKAKASAMPVKNRDCTSGQIPRKDKCCEPRDMFVQYRSRNSAPPSVLLPIVG